MGGVAFRVAPKGQLELTVEVRRRHQPNAGERIATALRAFGEHRPVQVRVIPPGSLAHMARDGRRQRYGSSRLDATHPLAPLATANGGELPRLEWTLAEEGFGSIERLQLFQELEQLVHRPLPEELQSADVRFGDLVSWLDVETGQVERPEEVIGGHRWAGRVARRLVQRVVTLDVQGAEFLPAEGPMLLCPNHRSLLDPLVVAAALSRHRADRVRVAVWDRQVRQGLRRHLFRLIPHLEVSRGRGADRSVREAATLLGSGESLIWHPEGHRSRSGKLLPFHPAAVWLACRTGTPLVPVAIAGTEQVLEPSRRIPRLLTPEGRPRVRVRFLAPFPVPASLEDGEASTLTEALRGVIRDALEGLES